jgi:hypothetical protein
MAVLFFKNLYTLYITIKFMEQSHRHAVLFWDSPVKILSSYFIFSEHRKYYILIFISGFQLTELSELWEMICQEEKEVQEDTKIADTSHFLQEKSINLT